MGFKVYGRPYYNDSDLTDTTISQSLQFDRPVILKAVRVFLIYYNDPTFTSLHMKIYGRSLTALHTSINTQVKADLFTDDYAVKETYFEFGNVNLAKDSYAFVLNADGYSGASYSKHIAWRVDDDPIYPVQGGFDISNIAKKPLCIFPIFARFDDP